MIKKTNIEKREKFKNIWLEKKYKRRRRLTRTDRHI